MSENGFDQADNHRRHGPERENDPARILGRWWQATRIVAAAFARPPLILAGIAPEPPARGAVAHAARGFPVVGLAIGLLAALVLAVADGLGLPQVLSAALAVGVMAFLGGALFETGLARFADALARGGGKADMLEALQDGAPSSYGILVLIIAFTLKVGALAWLPGPGSAVAALVAAAAASRVAVPVLLHYLPPAREDGLAAEAGRPAEGEMMLALALGVALALLFLGPGTGLVALGVGALGALKFAWLARRSLGGVTGSVLGAAQQGAEIGMLLAVVALR